MISSTPRHCWKSANCATHNMVTLPPVCCARRVAKRIATRHSGVLSTTTRNLRGRALSAFVEDVSLIAPMLPFSCCARQGCSTPILPSPLKHMAVRGLLPAEYYPPALGRVEKFRGVSRRIFRGGVLHRQYPAPQFSSR